MEPQAHGYLPPVSVHKSKQTTLQGLQGTFLLGLKVRNREHLAEGLAPQPEDRQHPRRVSRQLIPTGLEQDGHVLSREDVSIGGKPLTEGVRGRHIHQVHVEKLRCILNPITGEAANSLQA